MGTYSYNSVSMSSDEIVIGYDDADDNIVRAILSPPVVSNGLIAGEPTEFIGGLAVEDVIPPRQVVLLDECIDRRFLIVERHTVTNVIRSVRDVAEASG